MNGFEKLKARLREEGWYVGWNLPCCQSCAWSALPDYFDAQYDDDGYLIREDADGNRIEYEDIDLSKVLFNHSQDCEVYIDGEECPDCEGEGYDEDFEDCMTCFGKGEIDENFDPANYDTSVDGFICETPDTQHSSYFCFDGRKEGVANLNSILPIIEECGCKIYWDGTGDTRPEISW